MKKRFLIIQTAFIGDVILATPVINNLLSNIPDLEIDVLVKKENVSVLQGHKEIHQIYGLDKSRKMSSSFELIRLFRKNKYDTVINLHRFASSGIITTFSGAKQKIGFDKNPFSIFFSKKYEHVIGDGTHEVDRNLRLISQWVTDPSRRPDLKIDESENENTHDLKEEKYICLAPASVWATKEAPLEVWIKTIQNTSKEIKAIYLLGAPSDTEKCEELAKATKHKQVINLCGKLNLRESASLMKDAVMNYVNDSAPLHLASSVNAPVTVFFCSTSPSFGFGPLSSNSLIIEVRNLDCKPCGLHGHKNCPKGHFRCGKELLN